MAETDRIINTITDAVVSLDDRRACLSMSYAESQNEDIVCGCQREFRELLERCKPTEQSKR